MIRVGIGGWTYEPWRGLFFPKGHPKTRELEYASRKLSSIEINGTYYSTPTAASVKRWAEETPDDFVFAVKASRFATNRKVLAEGAPSVKRFLESGITELKKKLGPILWQFAPTKKFDAADFEGFLELLPEKQDGIALRHALEVRHESFCVPEFVALARKHNAAIVFADSQKYPAIADVTADFVYARLQSAQEKIETGYSAADLKKWAACAEAWEKGEAPKSLDLIAKAPAKKKRDVFVYMINGAKERAPAAAMGLIKLLE
jgi:uncharacterized protein YecE (DUF72 family)